MILYLVGLLAILPWLDRTAGSDAVIPFKKNLRRIVLPFLVWLVLPTLGRAFFCACLGTLFTFNLNETRSDQGRPRDWEEITLYSFALAFCLWSLAGWWAFIPAAWWALGVYWSNEGLPWPLFPDAPAGSPIVNGKLDWKFVEIGRGFSIALSILVAFFAR